MVNWASLKSQTSALEKIPLREWKTSHRLGKKNYPEYREKLSTLNQKSQIKIGRRYLTKGWGKYEKVPGAFIHGIFQARILECVAITYSRGLMLSNCGAGEDSWESLGKQGVQTSQY